MLTATVLLVACQKDDTDFSAYTDGTSVTIRVINITYAGSRATVTGDDNGFVTVNGADVTVHAEADTDSLLLVLSGSTTDGSLLVYRQKKFGLRLNGVSIHNNDGPAINNQCSKSLYLEVVSDTENTLTDGSSYTPVTDNQGNAIDQKGAFFSEGQVIITGKGTLTVTGSCQHSFASDDYIIVDDDVTLHVSSSTGNGIKVNDGIWIHGGTLDINVTAPAARGIKCDSVVVVTGGNTTISTSGNCVYDSAERDYSSAACIKCDYQFKMTGGTLTMTSSGDGGKGINCAKDVVLTGGTLSAVTTGSENNAKPKAVKGTTGITLSGGSFYAKAPSGVWACDNGSESSTYSARVTVVGSPATTSYAKNEVKVAF